MENCFEKISESILEQEFSIIDNFLSEDLAAALLLEAQADYLAGEFDKAKIGKGIEKKRISEIRGDEVKWLQRDAATKAQLDFWNILDGIRAHLSEFFRIHLERSEHHFAIYPPGSFYTKHLDQFQGAANRIFSVILYLNPAWKKGDGGELRIYLPGDQHMDVEPLYNRLIIFKSDSVEHELLLSHSHRTSLTGWIRRDKLIY